MGRLNMDGARFDGAQFGAKNKFLAISQTLGGTFTMDEDMPQMLFLDPGGSTRTVLLPPEARGLFYFITNTSNGADEHLTVKEDGNSTTIATIEDLQTGLFVCDGTAWKALAMPQGVAALADMTASAAELNYLDIATLGTGAASKAVVLDAGEDYVWPATGILTYGVLKDPAGTTLGATVAEINAAADVSARRVAIPDAATYVALVANSGKTHVFPDLTQDCTVTMPVEADGLEYEFIYAGVAADASNWIFDTGSDTNYFVGGLMFCDHDSADAEIAPIAGNGSSNSKLTIVKPAPGTIVRMICTGTLWVLSGFVNSDTIPSFADQ